MKIKQEPSTAFLILSALFVIFIILYINSRFNGSWLNDDAINLTQLSQNVYDSGTIAPKMGSYPFGYAYQSLNSFLSHLTGESIATIQRFWQPFMVVLVVPISFIAYRSLTGTPHIAALAVILLFLLPEFLFEALRSSHAKFTWSLALLMLFLLSRSLYPANRKRGFGAGVLAFYLATFALITSNSFFASNYVFGIVFAFLGVWILEKLPRNRVPPFPSQMRRLWLVALSCLILAFTFIFYIYPPALGQFAELDRIADKVAALLLDVEPVTTNPYGYVDVTWPNTRVYLAVSATNWIVLALSFMGWLYWGWRYIIRRREIPPTVIMLWLIYTGSAFLLALAVLLDVAGALSANMQVRLFPHFMVTGVPLAAMMISAGIQWLQERWPNTRFAVGIGLPLLLAVLAVGTLFKVTNEPLISNWWAFYLPGEQQAVIWNGEKIRANKIWVGDDRRLTILSDAYSNWPATGIQANRGIQPVDSRYVMWSPLVELRAMRMQYTPPDVAAYSRLYDNGQAQLLYSRSLTPFQK